MRNLIGESVEEAYLEGFRDAYRQCFDNWGREYCTTSKTIPGRCACVVALDARLAQLQSARGKQEQEQ